MRVRPPPRALPHHSLSRRVERTPPERLARYVELLQSEMPNTLAILVPFLAE
ncbi:MAG TPA: hypothetical protein PLV68_02595 [Ilumatobacteraceae bacterium]|nr:hypothetical protein [Ilumatobacteraceae bacterium]